MAKKAENKKVENKQEVVIKIEGQDWTEAVSKAFEEKRKDVTVSGFRKGKVPRNIYEKNFGKESLYMAIKDFLNNPELMEKCKKNAREVSKVFSKDIWIDKWKKVIKNYSKKVGKQENIYYNVTKIYVSPQNIESAKLNKIILEKLIDNNLVYIVNDNENRKHSYGRLQYVKEDEDLYRNFDYVLIDKDYENKENIIGEYIDI